MPPTDWPGALLLFKNIRNLFHPFHREGWMSDGFHGDGHQLHRIVIGRHPVGTHHAAALAPVDDGPFSVFPDPDSNRLHKTAAVCFPVTGFNIQMQTVQAVITVVSVFTAGTGR